MHIWWWAGMEKIVGKCRTSFCLLFCALHTRPTTPIFLPQLQGLGYNKLADSEPFFEDPVRREHHLHDRFQFNM
jgi:hypothetical protein